MREKMKEMEEIVRAYGSMIEQIENYGDLVLFDCKYEEKFIVLHFRGKDDYVNITLER